MDYLCTICCKRKRRDVAPLPAIRRYLSKRIQYVRAESMRRATPFILLSGRYGLLSPTDTIPWYDVQLHHEMVDDLVLVVAGQLEGRGATSITFFARPRSTVGWGPYYEVLEQACNRRDVQLYVESLGDDYI